MGAVDSLGGAGIASGTTTLYTCVMGNYIRLDWSQDSPDFPVTIFSELERGWEIRKVEVFGDGHVSFAARDRTSGDSELGLVPFPGVDVVNADPSMHVEIISADEFERAWRDATAS